MIFNNKNIFISWFFSLKILIVTVGCILMSNGCINKMELPADINTDVEFSAGDTTYYQSILFGERNVGFSRLLKFQLLRMVEFLWLTPQPNQFLFWIKVET